MQLALALRYYCDILNLRQADIARNSGFSSAYVSQIFTGKVKDPKASFVYKIAHAMGITVDELVERAEAYDDLDEASASHETSKAKMPWDDDPDLETIVKAWNKIPSSCRPVVAGVAKSLSTKPDDQLASIASAWDRIPKASQRSLATLAVASAGANKEKLEEVIAEDD